MTVNSRSFCSSSSIISAAFRLIAWGVLTQMGLAQTPLTLRVAQENVAAGGWAQIKVYADKPALITRGALALDLDPQVFGPIERVAAFSASGDVAGFARVAGTHVEIAITSPSGGIGQLPEVPVVAVRAPVLANATSPGFVSLSFPPNQNIGPGTANYPADAWAGPDNKIYSVTLVSGSVSTGALETITDVSPGGGFFPAGTVLTITGSGFSESSKITASGLAFSSVRVVSPTKVEASLASATEVTGARFRLEISPYSFADYFASPASEVERVDSGQSGLTAGTHMILPISELKTTSVSQPNQWTRTAVLQNLTLSPAEVRVLESSLFGAAVGSQRFTVAPGATASISTHAAQSNYYIDSGTPLRMLVHTTQFPGTTLYGSLSAATPWNGQLPAISLNATPSAFAVNYQSGTPAPEPRTVRFYSSQTGRAAPASIEVSGGSWLNASQPDASGSVTVSFDPTGLAPGAYKGTITGTPIVSSELSDFPVQTATVQVTLNVSTQPTLIIEPVPAEPPANTSYHTPVSLLLKTNGTPATFTASTATSDGGNWLSIDRTSGTTSATINIQANTTGLAGGYYDGTVTVAGPQGNITIRVNLTIYPIPKRPMTMTAAVTETREQGTGSPTDRVSLSVTDKSGPLTLQVATDDGGNWLSASVFDQNLNAVVFANIDSAPLPAGTYHGTITATAGGETVQGSVTLNILPKPTSLLRASPASLTFQTTAGAESAAQTLTIDSDGPALISFTTPAFVRVKIEGGGPLMAPGTFSFAGFNASPGTYTGSIVIKNSFGSTSVPVTVDVTGSGNQVPVLSSVVNAASHRATALAPGEMITVHGIGVGPQPTGVKLDEQGRISTNVAPETRVEINGQAAPVLYASPSQWNVIVPYEVADRSSATVRVLAYGVSSRDWTLAVVPAAPGIFTVSGSGVGQGAVLNQDNTVNSPTNPAPAGTIIQIFATGGGQSNPPATTGSVTPDSGGGGNQLPVKVFFADDEGSVVFAGPAPGFVAGALQVNAVVPSFGFPTSNKTLRLSLEINGVRSAPVDVTIR